MKTKIAIIIGIIIILLLVGCQEDNQFDYNYGEVLENRSQNLIECKNQTITVEKVVEKNIYVEKECAKNNTDIYNSTIKYVQDIKRLDRQLEECLYLNTSYYNGTRERECSKCIRDLNYTKNIMKDWNKFVGDK